MEKIVRRRWGGCLPHCWSCHALTRGREFKWLGTLKTPSCPTLSHLRVQITGWFPDKCPDWLAFTQGPTQPSFWVLSHRFLRYQNAIMPLPPSAGIKALPSYLAFLYMCMTLCDCIKSRAHKWKKYAIYLSETGLMQLSCLWWQKMQSHFCVFW